ncbi:MAG: heme ABC transporter ATP-binding protein [Moheibacter sp.]
MLTGNQLSLRKRNFNLLDRVKIEVERGELLVIIGPNGAGKSTLLSVLSNEQRADRGEIYFNDKKFEEWTNSDLAQYKAKFSQEFNSNIGLQTADIVMMGRYPYFDSKPKKEDIEIVEKMMKLTEIYPFRDRNYNQLSGGEKQRVHLTRVLVQLENENSNKLIFLDEPLNNLDVRHQRQILNLIREFTENGNSAVLVLHDLSLAAEFADKILLLKKGKVVAFGDTASIFKPELISEAFDFHCEIFKNPINSQPMVVFGEKNDELKKLELNRF